MKEGRRRIPLRDLIARGPVARPFPEAPPRPSGARYTGPAEPGPPVLPFLAFGVPYDLDLVVVDDHPDWDMHELARVQTPEGPVWLCKDSSVDLVQTIASAHPDLRTLLPEVPLARFPGPVEVLEGPDPVDVQLAWTNPAGERVEVRFRSGVPVAQRHRNSSTMGHSSAAVLAVLDLSHRAFGKAEVRIHGQPQRITRILGLIPFSLALVQTQAGFATGAWRQTPQGTQHGDLFQPWSIAAEPAGPVLTQVHPWRTVRARFVGDATQAECHEVEVRAWNGAVPACRVRLDPALPDLRRPFEGTVTSRFQLDVNGQLAHGVGTIAATSTPEEATLTIAPSAPRWLADRSLVVTLVRAGADVVARAVMAPARS